MPAKRRSRKADPSYNTYIGKILRKTHPQLGISSNALSMVNGIAEALASRLVAGSGKVARAAKKSTLSARHVQAATRVMLPFELCTVAVQSGSVAVKKFSSPA